MSDGKIVNVGEFSSPFQIDKSNTQSGESDAMGMKGPSYSGGSSKLGEPTIRTHVPPSNGGGVNQIQDVGEVVKPFPIGKNR